MSAIERDGVDLDGGDPDDTDGDARTGEPGRQWISTTRHPTDATLSGYVDKYFLRTKDCVARFGDKRVTYAVFMRSEEHTSELQSLMRISYAVFCLKKKKTHTT